METAPHPGSLNIAMDDLARAEDNTGSKIRWTIGRGTMSNDMFAHRESKDINEVAEQVCDAGSYIESLNFIYGHPPSRPQISPTNPLDAQPPRS